jgi:hypothetical protein
VASVLQHVFVIKDVMNLCTTELYPAKPFNKMRRADC